MLALIVLVVVQYEVVVVDNYNVWFARNRIQTHNPDGGRKGLIERISWTKVQIQQHSCLAEGPHPDIVLSKTIYIPISATVSSICKRRTPNFERQFVMIVITMKQDCT